MKSQIIKNKNNLLLRTCIFLILMLGVEVVMAQDFTVSFDKEDVSCFGAQDGRAAVIPEGGTGPYFFFWPNLSRNDSIVTGLPPGTYSVQVFDVFQNSGSGTVTILEPRPLDVTMVPNNVSCFGAQDGSVAANVTGGTTPYNFSWSNGETTQTITNLDPGPYAVTITDANGCTAGGVTRVTGPPELIFDVFPFNSSCYGSDDGGASTTASGGVPPYRYQWSNGARASFVNGLGPGVYGVTLTDRVNCQQTFQFVVTEPDSLEFRFQVTNVSCGNTADGSVTAFVNGGNPSYSFIWSNGETGSTIRGLAEGTYAVTVFDSRQCFNVDSVFVRGSDPINIRLNAVDVSCNGADDGRIDAVVTGGNRPYTYNWSNGGRDSFITDLGPDLYTLRLQDADGCDASIEININEPDAIDIDSRTLGLTCFGDSTASIEVDLRGGLPPYRFNWSNGARSNRIQNLVAGTYTLTFTDANDCRDSASFVINQPDEIEANLVTTDESAPDANDGTATVNPTNGLPPYRILWSTGSDNRSIRDLPPGDYSVRIRDANDCETNRIFTINPFSCRLTIERDSVEIDSINCFGGSNGKIAIKTRGEVDTVFYQWNTGDSTATIENLRAGTYTVIVSDSADCRDTLEIILPQPDLLVVSVSSTNETLPGANDGTASATPSGGTPPYNYIWSNGATSPNIDNLSPAVYSLVVTDVNGCSATASVTVAAAPGSGCGFSIDIFRQNLTCFGSNDGVARASVNGGTPPFSFLWSNGSTNNGITGLVAGIYSLTVTNGRNCRDSARVVISQPDELLPNASATDETSPGANDGTATANPSGGTPPYEYSWSNGESTQSITNLPPGTYEVLVTDNNGCDATQEVRVGFASGGGCGFDINVFERDISCFGNDDGLIRVSIGGGTPPFRFVWNTGATTNIISNLSPGTYSLTVIDPGSCRDSVTVIISEPAELLANASATDETSPGANDGTATANPTGGTPPYEYNWSNGESTQSITNLPPGTYEVLVTDDNGCDAIQEVTVEAATGGGCDFTIDIASQNITCFGGNDGQASAIITGGTPPFQFLWSNGARTSSITGLVAGVYSLTVTNLRNCSDSATVTIDQASAIVSNLTTSDETLAGANDGTAAVSPGGGTPTYNFLWSTGATTNAISGLSPGSYGVTITDQNNCQIEESFQINPGSGGGCGLSIFDVLIEDVRCFGGQEGGLTAFVRGGVPPFTYNWSNGLSGQIISGLGAGIYGLTVSDANNCLDSTMVSINQPAELIANLLVTDESQPNANDGAASVAPVGGNPPYVIQWSTGSNQEDVNGLAPAAYSVTITDSNNCEIISSFTIDAANCDLMKIRSEANPVSCFGDSDGTTFIEVGGGFPPYTYQWSNGAQSALVSGLRSGTYIVSVTDQAGCQIEDTLSVFTPPILILFLDVEPESEIGANDGMASVDVIGGTPPYNYEWSSGGSTDEITGLGGGSYSLTVTDDNGCESIEIFDIFSPLGCQARPGSMDTTEVIYACGLSPAEATFLGGELLENNDLLEFFLTDRNDGRLGNILARSRIPVFNYQSNMQLGQTYYISAAVGNDNGNQQIDLNDPCLSLSRGTLVQFGKDPVSPYALQGPEIVCGNEAFELEITDLYPDSSVNYIWIIPNGDTLFTDEPFLELTATSTAYTGDYFGIRDSAGCTSSLSPPLFIEVLSLSISEVDAGSDRVICSDSNISLSALEPSVGTGYWTTTSSARINNPGMNETLVSELQGGENVFIWTVALDECVQAATDTVVITKESVAVAVDDEFVVQRVSDEIVLEVILNDEVSSIPDTTLILLSEPAFGRLEYIEEEKAYRYWIDENRRGQVEFQYAICPQNTICNLACDTANVVIDILGLPDVPEGLTVNNDGINDDLQIKGIGGFSRVEILITNRWGNIVYQNNQYDNTDPWRGDYKNSGKSLPQGAYYYVLKAFENGEMVGKPQTGIIHLFTK